jgi:hypothetical protein
MMPSGKLRGTSQSPSSHRSIATRAPSVVYLRYTKGGKRNTGGQVDGDGAAEGVCEYKIMGNKGQL